MEEKKLEGLRVAILVTDGFEQVELTEPRRALEDAGAETRIISPVQGEVQGLSHDQKGDTFTVDLTLDQASPDDFDAVLLPGGARNAGSLRNNEQAQRFVQRIDQTEKPIGVICHGAWLLASAGLVNGRSLTSYPGIQDDLRSAGGTWLDQEVVTDHNWVSSRGPEDIPAFSKAILQLFPKQLLANTNKEE